MRGGGESKSNWWSNDCWTSVGSGGGGERKKKTLCPACNPPSIWTLTTPRRLVEKSYLESGMLSLYGCSRCAVSCLCLALHACRFHSLLAYSLTPFLRSWVFCFACVCSAWTDGERKSAREKQIKREKERKENEFRIDCRRSFVSFFYYLFCKTKYIVRI
jgi:hypothetical protein